jgi:hypothetical protein
VGIPLPGIGKPGIGKPGFPIPTPGPDPRPNPIPGPDPRPNPIPTPSNKPSIEEGLIEWIKAKLKEGLSWEEILSLLESLGYDILDILSILAAIGLAL